MSVEGTWNLTIDTPLGQQHAVLELSTRDGILHGVGRDQTHAEVTRRRCLTVVQDPVP